MATDGVGAVHCRYQPGPGSALVAPGVWLIAEIGPSDEWIGEFWSRIGDLDPGEVEAWCTSRPPRLAASSIAVVYRAGEGLRVLLTGTMSAAIGSELGNQILSCSPPVYSLTAEVDGQIGSIRLIRAPSPSDSDDRDAESVPIGTGVVPARSLVITWDEREVRSSPANDDHGSDPIEGRPPEMQSVGTAGSERSSAEDRLPGDTIFAIEDDDFVTRMEMESPELLTGGSNSPTGQTAPDDPGEDGAARLDGGQSESYDFLFGGTVNRSVVDAVVRVSESDSRTSDAEPAPRIDVESATPPGASPTPLQSDPPAPTPGPIIKAQTSGMIESVPWVERNDPDETPVAVPDARNTEIDDDVLGATVSRKRLDELRRAAPPSDTYSGPTVHAVRCPNGHNNPPHATNCRVCAAEVAEQSPLTMPRPVLGRLRFSTGDQILLDRDVIIGRRPTSDSDSGDLRPHLVRLDSPDQDISRNHVQVHLDDWHVLVTDLGSTNGTVVKHPEGPPVRLRPNDAHMIEPGTAVDIADVASFVFEVDE